MQLELFTSYHQCQKQQKKKRKNKNQGWQQCSALELPAAFKPQKEEEEEAYYKLIVKGHILCTVNII